MAGSQRPVTCVCLCFPIRNEDIVTRQNEACHIPPALRCPRAVLKTLASLPPTLSHKHEVVFKRWEESRTTAEGPQKHLPKRFPAASRGDGAPPRCPPPPPVTAWSCAGCGGCGSGPAPELQQVRDLTRVSAEHACLPENGLRLPPRQRRLKPLRTEEAHTWRSRSNRPSAWRPRYTGETHVRPLGSQSGSAEQFLERERSIRPAGTSSRLLPCLPPLCAHRRPPPSPGASSK